MKRENVPNAIAAASRGGFTLVELLAVMAIIGILAGMVFGITKIASGKAATARALADMELIKNELQDWQLKYGAYPKVDGARDGIDNTPMVGSDVFDDWVEDQVTEYSLTDPWDQSYMYIRFTPLQCEVWSMGPDGEPNTEDDLPENRGVD